MPGTSAARTTVGTAHARPVPAGRQAEALRAYIEIRDRLVMSSGTDPGPALRELESRILVQDPSLAESDLACLQTIPGSTQTGNLLERLSSFVGRTEELKVLTAAVRSGRLVTLIGPGGVGKTRLALEAAATLRQDHRDGAWLVELASVTEPKGVAPAIVGALGAAAAGRPAHHRRTRRWSSSCATSRDDRSSSFSTTVST